MLGNIFQYRRLRHILLSKKYSLIPVCPEQLGGCPTPRPAVEIDGSAGADVLEGRGRVLTENGSDETSKLIKGAEETLKIAKILGVKRAVLKSKSPSCGYKEIYNGSFSDTLKEGNGVTAELLIRNGIEVLTCEEYSKSVK